MLCDKKYSATIAQPENHKDFGRVFSINILRSRKKVARYFSSPISHLFSSFDYVFLSKREAPRGVFTF